MGKKSKKEHEKNCFRCRLHNLVKELYPKGLDRDDTKFCLLTFAEISGQILAEASPIDQMMFIAALETFKMNKKERNSKETKH
jgi:hypothetical protein